MNKKEMFGVIILVLIVFGVGIKVGIEVRDYGRVISCEEEICYLRMSVAELHETVEEKRNQYFELVELARLSDGEYREWILDKKISEHIKSEYVWPKDKQK